MVDSIQKHCQEHWSCAVLKGTCFYALYVAVYMSKNDKERRFNRLHCHGCQQPARHTEVATIPPPVTPVALPFPANQRKGCLLESAAAVTPAEVLLAVPSYNTFVYLLAGG